MTVRQLTVPIAGSTPAALVLPQPLTHEALGRLEAGLMDTLVRLRRELGGTAADATCRTRRMIWQRSLTVGGSFVDLLTKYIAYIIGCRVVGE